jgi:outer membrane protein assembly factor BamB
MMFVAAALVAGLASLPAQAATPAGTAAPAAMWTQDGYGPGNTGYNPAESVVNAGTVKKLKLRWTARLGAGPEGCRPAPVGPMVLGGRMFVLDSGSIGAYDVRTGKRQWLFSAPYFEGAGLAIVDGLVLGTEVNCFSNSDYDTNVIAIDPMTGKEVWNALQSWSIDTYVGDAGVFVVSGFCGICDDARYGSVAFRVSDGRRLWTRENAVLAGPVATGGRVMLRSTTRPDSEVVDIKTGDTLWGTGSAWFARAANPAGTQFYLWNPVGLSAVQAQNARTLWRVRGEAGDLASDGRRVFVASANRVNAYHATTGRLEWTRAVATPKRPIRAGGLLYVQSRRSLVILSPITGKPVASGVPFGTMSDHVVVTGGRLYVTSGLNVRAYTP